MRTVRILACLLALLALATAWAQTAAPLLAASPVPQGTGTVGAVPAVRPPGAGNVSTGSSAAPKLDSTTLPSLPPNPKVKQARPAAGSAAGITATPKKESDR